MALNTRIVWNCLTMACLVMALVCFSGCWQKSEAPDSTAGSESDKDKEGESAESGTPAEVEPEPTTEEGLTAEELLDAMVGAYKSATAYSDNALVKISGEVDGAPIEELQPYLVAFERPNKFRLQVGLPDRPGLIVIDGTSLKALSSALPEQFLRRDAPSEVTLDTIYVDHQLSMTMMQGASHTFAWIPVQLMLLMADDPLKTLLYQADRPTLLPPAKIEQQFYDRVQVDRLDGTVVFWIARKTHVLRRFEFPVIDFQTTIVGMTIKDLSLVADFHDARLNAEIESVFFEFEAPPNSKPVVELVPPYIAMLGKPVPELKLVDSEGEPVSRESLTKKITVLSLWSLNGPCRETMPPLQRVYDDYKDRVSFYLLSIDNESVKNGDLTSILEEIGIKVPFLRKAEPEATAALHCSAVPTTILLDEKGNVQDYSIGVASDLVVQLSRKLDKLLAGEAVSVESLARYQTEKEMFAKMRRESIEKDLFIPLIRSDQQLVRAEIAERTEPEKLKLTQLWHAEKMSLPSNILTIQRPNGPPRILVLDDGKTIVEFDTKGNVKGTFPLNHPSEEPIRFLRTATDSKGKRYFAGAASSGEQVHFLDEHFKLLWSYPKDAHDNPYGVGDVLLSDLDANGQPEIYIGFLNVTGVHAVSLEGKGLWRNRTVANAVRLAVLDPNARGHRMIVSVNNDGTSPGNLVAIDRQGKRVTQLGLPNRSLGWIAVADLNGDDRSELMSLCADGSEDLFAVGLNLEGHELWSYPFPQGAYEYPLDPVTSGHLLGDGLGQWILGASDGTIHILTSKGALLDTFAYGAPLSGLAATQWDGKQVLLVATPGGVDAWQVQLPAE